MDALERYLGDTERSVRALSRDEIRRVAAALFDASRWRKRVWVAAASNATAAGARLGRILYDAANLGTLAENGRIAAGDVLLVVAPSGVDSELAAPLARAKTSGALSVVFCRLDDELASAADLRVVLGASSNDRAEDILAIVGRGIALSLRERAEHYAVSQANAAAAAVGG